MLEQKLEPEMKLRFRISFPEFLEFNLSVSRPVIQKNKRKLTVLGAVEALAGLGLMLSCIFLFGGVNSVALFLGGVLVAVGVFTLLYVAFLFPRQIEQAAVREYAKNAYLQNEVELAFYDGYYLEASHGGVKAVPQEQVCKVEELERSWLLMAASGKVTVIPKAAVSAEDRQKLSVFLIQCGRDRPEPEKISEKRLVI